MKGGLSQPSCSQEELRFLEDRATNNPHDITCMMYYNKVVKNTKHRYEKNKEWYKEHVDAFAKRLKEHVELTSGEEGEDWNINQSPNNQKQ